VINYDLPACVLCPIVLFCAYYGMTGTVKTIFIVSAVPVDSVAKVLLLTSVMKLQLLGLMC
jgi:hypothetical protein